MRGYCNILLTLSWPRFQKLEYSDAMSFPSFLPSRIACPLETWTRGVCCRAYKSTVVYTRLSLYFLSSSPLIFKCTIKVVDEFALPLFLKIMDIPEYSFVAAHLSLLSLSKLRWDEATWLETFVELKKKKKRRLLVNGCVVCCILFYTPCLSRPRMVVFFYFLPGPLGGDDEWRFCFSKQQKTFP
jgi:hypothetical protein